MKIIDGRGSSSVLVKLECGNYGVGVVYDDNSFVGETFPTLAEAVEVHNSQIQAAASYFKTFGNNRE